MQLNALNSVNFGHKSKNYSKPIETTFVERDDECDAFEKHIKTVEKAKRDVSPLTVLAGGLAAAFALKKGSKLVSIIRSASAKGADEVLGIVKKVTKKEMPEKLSNLTDKIGRQADEYNTDKIQSKFVDIVDSIFSSKGQTKGQNAVEALNRRGIYLNGKSLFDNGVAAAGAVMAMDIASDIAEENVDEYKINKSAKEVNKYYNDVAQEIVSVLTD